MYKLLLIITGWKVDTNTPKEYKRCVLVGAPHTSNWDLFYAILLLKTLKVPFKFTIKNNGLDFHLILLLVHWGEYLLTLRKKRKMEMLK